MLTHEAPEKPVRHFLARKPIADLMLDGRSRPAKRKRELVEIFTAALGRDVAATDPILRRKVAEAAELATIAEMTRAKCMQGEATTNDVVRASRAAALAERALGIDIRRKPAKPDLSAHLAAKAAAA